MIALGRLCLPWGLPSACVLLLALSACISVPEIGRHQFLVKVSGSGKEASQGRARIIPGPTVFVRKIGESLTPIEHGVFDVPSGVHKLRVRYFRERVYSNVQTQTYELEVNAAPGRVYELQAYEHPGMKVSFKAKDITEDSKKIAEVESQIRKTVEMAIQSGSGL